MLVVGAVVVDHLHILDPPADRLFDGIANLRLTHPVC